MDPTTKYVGQKVKVYVASLAGETPLIIAGQRDADYNVEIDGIDSSDKDSEGFWDENIAGGRRWNLSCSGAHVLGDESLEIMEDALIQEEHTHDTGQVMVFLVTEGGQVRYGRVLVTTFNLTAPKADLATYSMSFNGNGPIRKAAALPAAFDAVYGVGSFSVAVAKAKVERAKIAEKMKSKLEKQKEVR